MSDTVQTPGFDDPVPEGETTSLGPARPDTSPAPPSATKKVETAIGQTSAKRVASAAAEVDKLARAEGLGAARVAVKRVGPAWLPSDERGVLETIDIDEFKELGFVETVRERFGGGKYLLMTLAAGDVEIPGERWTIDVGGEPIVTTPMGFAALDRMNERKQQRGNGMDPAALLTAVIAAAKELHPPAPPRAEGEKSMFQMMLDSQAKSEERILAENDRRAAAMKADADRREADRKADEARRDAERQAERERDRRDRDERDKERQRQHELEIKRMDMESARQIEAAKAAAKDPGAGLSLIEKAGQTIFSAYSKLGQAQLAGPEKPAVWEDLLGRFVSDALPKIVEVLPQLMNGGQAAAAAIAPIAPQLPAPALTRGAAGAPIASPPPLRPAEGAVPAGTARLPTAPAALTNGAPTPPKMEPMSRGTEGGSEIIPTSPPPPTTTDVQGDAPVATEPPPSVDIAPPDGQPQGDAVPSPDQVAMMGIAETLANFVGTVAVMQTRQMKPARAWLTDDGRLSDLFEELPEPMQDALAKEGWEKFASALPAEGPGVPEIARNMETEIGRDWMKRFLAAGPWTWPEDEEEEEDDEETPDVG